jgi:AcrR family transcriptional regulator
MPAVQSAVKPVRKLTFREQQFAAREEAILSVVNRLLASKGFDLMTMDEVAGEVGIAKPSLYRHFESKEHLAAVAMERLLDRLLAVTEAQPPQSTAQNKLKALLAWALREHLQGTLPLLPSTRSSLRQALTAHRPYVDRLVRLTDTVAAWIEQGKAQGALRTELPTEVLMLTLFARACDPTLEFLRETGQFTDERVIELMLACCFEGLATRPSA